MNIYQKNYNEWKAIEIQNRVDKVGQFAYLSAQALNQAYEIFWSGTEEEVIEFLNFLGPQTVLQLFQTHLSNGNAINSVLDNFEGKIPHRAIVGPKYNVDWDFENSTFYIVQPEVEEPEPNPELDPEPELETPTENEPEPDPEEDNLPDE